MSAANFIALFKAKKASLEEASDYVDYTRWLKTNKTWFNKSRKDLESMGLSKNVGFVISETKAAELGVSKAFIELAETFKNNKDIGSPIVDVVDGKRVILFSDVPFKGGIESTLDKYFGKGTYDKGRSINQIKGHVFGFMTGALIGARDELSGFLTKGDQPIMGQEEADHALDFLDILIRHLERLDIDSAEIKTFTSKVFLKYNKSSSNFLVELQSETDNAVSAKLVQKLAGLAGGKTGIRGLINATPGVNQTEALAGVMEVLRADGKFSNREILDFESSPSMKNLMLEDIASALSTGKPKKNKYAGKITTPTVLTTLYVDEVAKRQYKEALAKVKTEAKVARAKIAANKRKQRSASSSIVNLVPILNARLADQIKKNMGTGNAKNVLNYRTGRLAESAKVERVSQSREGLISVFYDYMKNPYSTFSDGGAQQSPKTRDPKILISKSIREIGASMAYNRMRAVLV